MLGIEKAFSKYYDFGGNGSLSFQKITKQFRKKRLNNFQVAEKKKSLLDIINPKINPKIFIKKMYNIHVDG